MPKWIAIACVLGWSFVAVFGYLALTGWSKEPSFQTLIAGELALYGLAVGCVTWVYLRSNRAKAGKSRSLKN
ncbi:MAG: hypothetical protein OIF40_12000 [Mangrovicoccus sp.]|nr:hypothetical protein [Mangrovicoccus sp.]